MARPETTDDISISQVEFGSIDVNLIADRGGYLAAYATFMQAVQDLGGEVVVAYNTRATFSRPPTDKDQADQLTTAQVDWDRHKKWYDTMAEVGELEYDHYTTAAKSWAKAEGLPWPPPHEPISDFHSVVLSIDQAVRES